MNTKELRAAEQRLTSFLAELVPYMGRAERQHWAGMYIRGLLLDGERKSIEPMAARLPGGDTQALCQFVNQSPWPWEPLQAALTGAVVDALLPEAVYLLDTTSFPKQGTHLRRGGPAVLRGAREIANCQVAVSLHLGTTTTSVPLTWRSTCRRGGRKSHAPGRGGDSRDRHLPDEAGLGVGLSGSRAHLGLQPRPVLADSELQQLEVRPASTRAATPTACRSSRARSPGPTGRCPPRPARLRAAAAPAAGPARQNSPRRRASGPSPGRCPWPPGRR